MSAQQYVIFNIDDVEYGIDIMLVDEIVKMQNITKVPKTPDFVEGITNLRGTVIPIVNLRTKFNLPKIENDDETRIIVVNLDVKTFGIIVDKVAEITAINNEQIDKSAVSTKHFCDEYVYGVAKLDNRLIILLDLESFFKN